MNKIKNKFEYDLIEDSLLILNNYDINIKKNSILKLAIFDLDFTLIKPKNFRTYPKFYSDWEWTFDNVIDKLNEL